MVMGDEDWGSLVCPTTLSGNQMMDVPSWYGYLLPPQPTMKDIVT